MFSQSVRIVPIYTYTLISENLYREVYENDTTFESVVILENIKIKSAGVDSHHPTNSFLNLYELQCIFPFIYVIHIVKPISKSYLAISISEM